MIDEQAFKFKKLVEICVETKNYRKIAAITLAMIKNEVNSHLITLNLPLSSDASIHEMMSHVNTILREKFGIIPYKGSMITQLKLIENLMEKGKGIIPVRFIKDAISLYYDVRQISLLPFNSVTEHSPSKFSKGLISRFSQSNNESIIQKLISDELSSREKTLRSKIEVWKDENALKELQKISFLKESLTSDAKRKIRLNDRSVTQDQRYFLFFTQSKAYPFLGIFFLLAFLSILVLVQMTLNLGLLSSLGMFFLMFAGSSAFSLYLYGFIKKKVINNSW